MFVQFIDNLPKGGIGSNCHLRSKRFSEAVLHLDSALETAVLIAFLDYLDEVLFLLGRDHGHLHLLLSL